ncbi:NADH dehydrogenase-like complex subunit J2 [Salinarchaeum sp. Harcht-Bsk1]|nr:NADH dehydrogenase-like complex subunit J2 [Salinarchaeum sp. Harcht-Bsk1]
MVPGLVAVALFAVMAWVFLGASFGEAAGFPGGASVIDTIGYALMDANQTDIPTEGFMAALIIIALVLDAALDGAIHLARRDDEGDTVTALGGDDE